MASTIPSSDLGSFHAHLKTSTRVLALLGAGLSASSGLPTFRGADGLWRTHSATSLATPQAFLVNPSLVWQFYSHRRHMALNASPNPAHDALAALARALPGFQCLSQNVDGLSRRAGHPPDQLQLLHGTLFSVKCSNETECGHQEPNFTDPIVPALAIPTSGADPTSNTARHHNNGEQDISNISVPLAEIPLHALPICPKCTSHLLRPGVVWFGEPLPPSVLKTVDRYIDAGPIDLILVIGTSAKVWPAAGYIDEAREQGARVCVVNLDESDSPPAGWTEGDWFFRGDAAVVVPQLLGPVIGDGDVLVSR
ncbi:hypothetical protein LTR62_003562 [Meristemomyces frigidus]|uniref:Deacetylase sirtuin-type domain-containing protein n=1 Tax=Meristemomyces frigidus TaxID=1508187 RepID=A0AAN7TKT5_9PEZI|nr:hypothetical protein LTR62_003562 [Meristemomyces frigidus]